LLLAEAYVPKDVYIPNAPQYNPEQKVVLPIYGKDKWIAQQAQNIIDSQLKEEIKK